MFLKLEYSELSNALIIKGAEDLNTLPNTLFEIPLPITSVLTLLANMREVVLTGEFVEFEYGNFRVNLLRGANNSSENSIFIAVEEVMGERSKHVFNQQFDGYWNGDKSLLKGIREFKGKVETIDPDEDSDEIAPVCGVAYPITTSGVSSTISDTVDSAVMLKGRVLKGYDSIPVSNLYDKGIHGYVYEGYYDKYSCTNTSCLFLCVKDCAVDFDDWAYCKALIPIPSVKSTAKEIADFVKSNNLFIKFMDTGFCDDFAITDSTISDDVINELKTLDLGDSIIFDVKPGDEVTIAGDKAKSVSKRCVKIDSSRILEDYKNKFNISDDMWEIELERLQTLCNGSTDPYVIADFVKTNFM